MITAIYIVLIYFITFFIVATIIKNNSIVDIGWGLGYVISSWILFFITKTYTTTQIIMNIMISLWGLRLFYYILKRNIFEKEDFRYANWRKAWGKFVIPRAFLQVFMLQGFLMYLIASTSFYINSYNLDFNLISIIGIVIWVIGYFFEVVGDKQLKVHISKKTGTLLETGLWKITRHPNYFGEVAMWSGLFIFALLNGAPWYLVISPLVISSVLRFISIPILEEKMKRKDRWDEYASKTPILFPFIGKKG